MGAPASRRRAACRSHPPRGPRNGPGWSGAASGESARAARASPAPRITSRSVRHSARWRARAAAPSPAGSSACLSASSRSSHEVPTPPALPGGPPSPPSPPPPPPPPPPPLPPPPSPRPLVPPAAPSAPSSCSSSPFDPTALASRPARAASIEAACATCTAAASSAAPSPDPLPSAARGGGSGVQPRTRVAKMRRSAASARVISRVRGLRRIPGGERGRSICAVAGRSTPAMTTICGGSLARPDRSRSCRAAAAPTAGGARARCWANSAAAEPLVAGTAARLVCCASARSRLPSANVCAGLRGGGWLTGAGRGSLWAPKSSRDKPTDSRKLRSAAVAACGALAGETSAGEDADSRSDRLVVLAASSRLATSGVRGGR
eukprot:scaffold1364_cov116-Isochrysis_galbana.AAC.5